MTAHRGLEHARDRGKEASAASCGAIWWLVVWAAMPPRLARVRASLYVQENMTLLQALIILGVVRYYGWNR